MGKNNAKIIAQIRRELQNQSEEKFRKGVFHFFKEEINPIGVRLPKVRKIAVELDKKLILEGWFFPQILKLAGEFQKSKLFEEQILASYLVERHSEEYTKETFFEFEKWIGRYVKNWANCDLLCTHSLAACIEKYPEFIGKLMKWTQSKNRWVRRAAIVTFVLHGRKGKFLKETLQIAKKLMHDNDDLVQKGTGWTLREAAKANEEKVFAFLLLHKDAGRTLLRYAVERFAENRKKQVLYGKRKLHGI
ncbi:DNA alkylation repair protein [Candidatus Micrarchaeota archaeon]|nr:DNA alkylation repair protein [Candidatus Micrarchaeota archaeon]